MAGRLDRKTHVTAAHTFLLDGESLPQRMNRGFGVADHYCADNVRRLAEVAKLMADSGPTLIIVLVPPFRFRRRIADELTQEGEFVEVFLDTPLEVYQPREHEGLCNHVRACAPVNFTGSEPSHEAPPGPYIVLKGTNQSPDPSADRVITYLNARSRSFCPPKYHRRSASARRLTPRTPKPPTRSSLLQNS